MTKTNQKSGRGIQKGPRSKTKAYINAQKTATAANAAAAKRRHTTPGRSRPPTKAVEIRIGKLIGERAPDLPPDWKPTYDDGTTRPKPTATDARIKFIDAAKITAADSRLAAFLGVPACVFLHWVKEGRRQLNNAETDGKPANCYGRLAALIDEARGKAIFNMEARAIAQSKAGDTQMTRWWLERRAPKEYKLADIMQDGSLDAATNAVKTAGNLLQAFAANASAKDTDDTGENG